MPKALLAILDGYGIADDKKISAIDQARTPFYDYLSATYPNSRLSASGTSVGLPDGQFGNSEVGHLNIGAGRIVWQELTRINQSIDNGEFYANETLLQAAETARKRGKVHLMGLFSDGGVHSHMKHLIALVEFFSRQLVGSIYIHAFTDGRDTSPHGGARYIEQLENELQRIGAGTIASVVGRYFAMDRDNRWDRTRKAYRLLTAGEGERFDTAAKAIQHSYQNGVTDEFVEPCLIDPHQESRIQPDDTVVFFNIRGDRARQITSAFTNPAFSEFEVDRNMHLDYVTLTSYDKAFEERVNVAYPPLSMDNTLGEVISKQQGRQLRIAETEKYPHVTYFFNGGVEQANEGEERILIPSPKVATYDQKPEMSAHEVTDRLCDEIRENDFDFILVNFANPDMVGHTGDMDATVKAVETVDGCLKRVVESATEQDYRIIIIADHGNADRMKEADGSPHTAHTDALVPFIVVNHPEAQRTEDGILADVAPSLLKAMEIRQPEEMTGKPLF